MNTKLRILLINNDKIQDTLEAELNVSLYYSGSSTFFYGANLFFSDAHLEPNSKRIQNPKPWTLFMCVWINTTLFCSRNTGTGMLFTGQGKYISYFTWVLVFSILTARYWSWHTQIWTFKDWAQVRIWQYFNRMNKIRKHIFVRIRTMTIAGLAGPILHWIRHTAVSQFIYI